MSSSLGGDAAEAAGEQRGAQQRERADLRAERREAARKGAARRLPRRAALSVEEEERGQRGGRADVRQSVVRRQRHHRRRFGRDGLGVRRLPQHVGEAGEQRRPHRLRRRAQRIDRREPGGGAGRGVEPRRLCGGARRGGRRVEEQPAHQEGLRRGEHGARPALRLRQPRREAHGARRHLRLRRRHAHALRAPLAQHGVRRRAPKTSAESASADGSGSTPIGGSGCRSAGGALARLSGRAARRAAEHNRCRLHGEGDRRSEFLLVVVGLHRLRLGGLHRGFRGPPAAPGRRRRPWRKFSTESTAQRLSSTAAARACNEHTHLAFMRIAV